MLRRFVINLVFLLGAAANGQDMPLPSVQLPPALDRVLRDYERAWQAHDGSALAELFAEDGFVLSNGQPPVRGRAAIRVAYATSGGPLALRAFAYRTDGSVGYIIGTWEYRQRAGDSYDNEGERIEFRCTEGALHGLYFGLEREGEHGLFYTLESLKNLDVRANGENAFTVPGRDLFSKRPRNLQERKDMKSSGGTVDELHFTGRLDGEKLRLRCESKRGSCPEPTMIFQKGALAF